MSLVLAIFPFEVGLYQEAGVTVEFVGHPVLDVLPAPRPRRGPRGGSSGRTRRCVGVLPGSRAAEVRRHLPVLLDAARRIVARRPRTRFAVAVAPTIPVPGVTAAVRAAGIPAEVLPGEAYRVMAAADLLLVASGTATLEAACYGAPMIVLYRLSATSHALARLLVRGVSHISLPNIIAGRAIVPELIQGQATPGGVAAAALGLLDDAVARTAQRLALLEVRTRLGQPGAGLRAARAVLRERRGIREPLSPPSVPAVSRRPDAPAGDRSARWRRRVRPSRSVVGWSGASGRACASGSSARRSSMPSGAPEGPSSTPCGTAGS